MLRSCFVGSALAFATRSVVSAQVNLGSAYTFGVLAGVQLSNDGPTNVIGNVGVFPGFELLGFPSEWFRTECCMF